MGGVAILRLVVPQAEPAFDRWVFAGAPIFSSARCEVSALESLSGPNVPVSDMISGMGVGEVRVNARINACVSETDACPHDTVFEGLSLIVPLATSVRDAPLHCQDPIILVHQSTTPLCLLMKADDFCSYFWIVEADVMLLGLVTHHMDCDS
jgi:hypothetical protein